MGIGNAGMWGPLATTATRNLSPRQAGAGAGIYNTTRTVGSVIGSASIAAFMQARLEANLPGAGDAAGRLRRRDAAAFVVERLLDRHGAVDPAAGRGDAHRAGGRVLPAAAGRAQGALTGGDRGGHAARRGCARRRRPPAGLFAATPAARRAVRGDAGRPPGQRRRGARSRSYAQIASSTRLRAPSLAMMLARCVFTVLSEMCSSAPISELPSPLAAAASTASSLSVSGLDGGVGGPAAESGERLDEPHGDRRIDERVAPCGGAHGLREHHRPGILEQEAPRTCPQRRVDVLVEIERGDDDDRNGVGDVGPRQPPSRLEAVHDRHPDIQKAHIGTDAARQRDRLRAVRRLADDLDPGLRVEDHPQSRAHKVLVVGDQHAHVTPPTPSAEASRSRPTRRSAAGLPRRCRRAERPVHAFP